MTLLNFSAMQWWFLMKKIKIVIFDFILKITWKNTINNTITDRKNYNSGNILFTFWILFFQLINNQKRDNQDNPWIIWNSENFYTYFFELLFWCGIMNRNALTLQLGSLFFEIQPNYLDRKTAELTLNSQHNSIVIISTAEQ